MHAVEEKIKWLQVNEPVLPNIPMTNLTPDVPKECLKYVLKIFLQAINFPTDSKPMELLMLLPATATIIYL